MDGIKKFFDEVFFYRFSKEEKVLIRSKIVKEDHKSYGIVLALICLLQIIMTVISYVRYGVLTDDKPWVNHYRIFYISLIIACVIASVLIEIAIRNKNDFFYFVIASCMMVFVGFWAVGITSLDSHAGVDLATYSYIMVALSMLVTIEPWISSLNLAAITICLNLHFAFSPSLSQYYGFGVIANSISVLAISIIASCFTFYRRVNKLKYEIKNEELLEKIENQAVIDDLTGIYNRRYLTSHINDPLKIGIAPTGVMMLDIDHFKKVNDIYGHKAGDDTLRVVGSIIKEFVGNEGYCVRYGGEEFLIYFQRIRKEDLIAKAEELRKRFEETDVNINGDVVINFTVSIGLAIASGVLSYSGLISKADEALYKAKETRNSCYIEK